MQSYVLDNAAYADQNIVGTATVNDVLAGKTFTSESGVGLNGAMVNRGAWTNTPASKGKVTIPVGYHNGSGYVDTTSVYNAGITAADSRVNTNSTNYQSGYNAGYNAGINDINTSTVKSATFTVTHNTGAYEYSDTACYTESQSVSTGIASDRILYTYTSFITSKAKSGSATITNISSSGVITFNIRMYQDCWYSDGTTYIYVVYR